jgi:hypothetical protein
MVTEENCNYNYSSVLQLVIASIVRQILHVLYKQMIYVQIKVDHQNSIPHQQQVQAVNNGGRIVQKIV